MMPPYPSCCLSSRLIDSSPSFPPAAGTVAPSLFLAACPFPFHCYFPADSRLFPRRGTKGEKAYRVPPLGQIPPYIFFLILPLSLPFGLNLESR